MRWNFMMAKIMKRMRFIMADDNKNKNKEW